ncbi:MAG: orotate phosphoribosyltransferase, partial [Anaerolineae bacterium]
ILAPGVGAQGGDLKAALAAGLDADGSGLLVPVSRHVIYADDPRAAAQRLRDEIEKGRKGEGERGGEGESRQRSLPVSPSLSISPSPSPSLPLILALHDAGCVQFGAFTLASGVQSPIYLDLRRMASYPALLRMAADAYAELLRPLSFDLLAAVPYAALTIGAAVALATDKPLIYPRKEVKSYGTGRAVEGDFQPGQRAAVIEDLVTSAGSVLTAIQTLESAGLDVSDVVVLIDRQQGGLQNLAAAGYQLHAALTMAQIVHALEAIGRISAAQAAGVRDYLGAPS